MVAVAVRAIAALTCVDAMERGRQSASRRLPAVLSFWKRGEVFSRPPCMTASSLSRRNFRRGGAAAAARVPSDASRRCPDSSADQHVRGRASSSSSSALGIGFRVEKRRGDDGEDELYEWLLFIRDRHNKKKAFKKE